HELLLKHPDILAHYQQRFRHVLVDEFQDTNTIQYAWLRLLAGVHRNAFVVGDDDQSIYGWRGAKVENIRRFSEHFPGTKVFRLEQNYRSTAAILDGANALIACNDSRMGKNLWTSGDQGELIQLYGAFNEQDEADFVVERIRQWIGQGHNRDESAILYRSNAQSRVFEEKLIQAGMPYRVYGGQRFFERAEIKDALAYLRLIANPHDEASFERVVNQPTRGIGGQTLTLVREQAKVGGVSLHRAAELLVRGESLSARARNALLGFLHLLEELGQGLEGLPLGEQVEQVLAESGLWEHYSKEKGEKGISRRENLEELVNAARQFAWEDDESGLDPLSIFLSHAALEAGEAQADAAQDCVQLMTLHSAKGLEFPLVFLCGMEEGLFPHKLSVAEPGRLEEERRLCYVGMTRARRHLILSWAEQRRLHGSENYCMPSRFLNEIPTELVEEIRPTAKPGRAATTGMVADDMASAFRLGQRVRHNKFGSGVVLSYEGQGSHARVQVNFERAGAKWLVVAYANLQMV
ncbi:MAG: 3'-5' exonuclease, partial [Gammaproteobacteria bacterium]